jgi:putative membrane protein
MIIVAIDPIDTKDWLLENILVVIALPVLWKVNKHYPLSKLAFTFIFIFLFLHEIGSHYTYALVPYKEWFQNYLGIDLGEGRNHYDRLVHFLYGFLLTLPLREVLVQRFHVKKFLSYFIPVDLIMSTSMIYELIEWAVAIQFGGELGQNYLGTQGDVWDAHKDMGLASLGSIFIMLSFILLKRKNNNGN